MWYSLVSHLDSLGPNADLAPVVCRTDLRVLRWLEGMRAEAAGNYQEAAQVYSECLGSGMPSLPPEDVAFLSDRAAACYSAIADWDAANRSQTPNGVHPARARNSFLA
jgi:hypothetical protein